MVSPTEQRHHHFHHHIAGFLKTTTVSLSSLFPLPKTAPPPSYPPQSRICVPFKTPDSLTPTSEPTLPDSVSSSSAIKSVSPAESGSGFPSTVRIAGLKSNGNGGGPAFVGQVFSMCDLSGTGLMAVSTHFDIPFISRRTPKWLKKVFSNITKSERNGPVFRFFMDIGDAVSYVKQLNIPSGVVGACRLDLAYEHFKEKPHLFQFVPNEKQVKAANKILKEIPQNSGKIKVQGVPVFGAQNLDIAVATSDGIKWYTPYFFDKSMLDNILEESVDQHFQSLIQTRHMQRRGDVIDENIPPEVMEEMNDSVWEPPEVQEVIDEIGHPGIPLGVISKVAEIQLLYAVDSLLLGNRWLRKATGIQPRFPYLVDSFERRSAASFQRASQTTNLLTDIATDSEEISQPKLENKVQVNDGERQDFQFPFGDWFSNPWLKQENKARLGLNTRAAEIINQNIEHNPRLPKITMVGISTGEAGNMSKANVKKTMKELSRELEESDNGLATGSSNKETKAEERDPLFVANVGDYYSGVAKTGSARWVRRGNNNNGSNVTN